MEKISGCLKRLAKPREKAPKLRAKHLASRLEVAQGKKKKMAVKRIMNIICREASQKKWRQIGHTIFPQQGRAISRVPVPTEFGDTTYAT